MKKEKPPEVLSKYFKVKDAGDAWDLRCKICNEGWKLKKQSAERPGNVLTLMNHAYSHGERARVIP